MKKLILISVSLYLVFLPINCLSESTTMHATGEYVMGDNDTYTEAKKLALQDAKRIMLEKIGTYLESKTEIKNGVVSSDEVKQYSAGIIKVREVSDERSIVNKATILKVNVEASVDPDAVVKQVLSFRNRQGIEESARKLSEENRRLSQEILQLNNQLRNITNESKFAELRNQRTEILKKIDSNEKGLTMILSGENLYTAALINRKEKDDYNVIVHELLEQLAEACVLSASSPQIEDNGNQTATVIFDVSANFTLTGVNTEKFQITGLKLDRSRTRSNAVLIRCDYRKCKEAYRYASDTIKSLLLYVKVGSFERKEKIAVQCFNNPCIPMQVKKHYEIKVPVDELKAISQIQVKILYDSKEYGRTNQASGQAAPPSQKAKPSSHFQSPEEEIIGIKVEEKETTPISLRALLGEKDHECIITEVKAGSPAEKAGLKINDSIRAVDNTTISSRQSLSKALFWGIKRHRVHITIKRGFTIQKILVHLR